MSDPFVTVYRTTSPIDAEMVADILTQNNVAARALGTRSAAMIGAAQSIVQLRVEVPASQAEQACEFIEAFFAASVVADHDEGADDDDLDAELEDEPSASEGGGTAGRSRLMTLGAALMVFGGSHFYTGRPGTAVVIALGQAWALAAMFAGDPTVGNAAGGMLFYGLICYDIIGGQLAAAAGDRGSQRTFRWQVLVSLGIVLGFFAAANLVASSVAKRHVLPASNYLTR